MSMTCLMMVQVCDKSVTFSKFLTFYQFSQFSYLRFNILLINNLQFVRKGGLEPTQA